jgi:ankyrin repeat protein
MQTQEEEEFDPQNEFFECCRYGDEDTGISILENYPDIDPTRADEYGTTPLHAAAANGLVRLLEEIIRRFPAIDYNVRTPGGNTPLHYASLNKNSKIIAMLVEVGANVKAQNQEGQSPLYEAMNRLEESNPEDVKAVDLLLGPDSDIPKGVEEADDIE